jgi:hypothetical protein
VYVQSNIEERSCNHCCSGKAMRITYSECVFLSSGIFLRHIVMCGLPGGIVLFLINQYDIRGKKYWAWNACFVFPCNAFYITRSKKNWATFSAETWTSLILVMDCILLSAFVGCVFCVTVLFCVLFVCKMCTVLLPPGYRDTFRLP